METSQFKFWLTNAFIFTPKFFVREGLKDSIVNDSLVTDDWVNSFHDMVLLEDPEKQSVKY